MRPPVTLSYSWNSAMSLIGIYHVTAMSLCLDPPALDFRDDCSVFAMPTLHLVHQLTNYRTVSDTLELTESQTLELRVFGRRVNSRFFTGCWWEAPVPSSSTFLSIITGARALLYTQCETCLFSHAQIIWLSSDHVIRLDRSVISWYGSLCLFPRSSALEDAQCTATRCGYWSSVGLLCSCNAYVHFNIIRARSSKPSLRDVHYLRLCHLATFTTRHGDAEASLTTGDDFDIAVIFHSGIGASRFFDRRNVVTVEIRKACVCVRAKRRIFSNKLLYRQLFHIPPIRYLARQRTDNHISDCNGPFIRKYICWDHQHLSRILKWRRQTLWATEIDFPSNPVV